MFPEITNGSTPPSLAVVERFERDRGLTLPALYRQFLLATNGGVPSSQTFPITGMALNPTGSVQVFFGIGVREPTNELAYGYDLYTGGIPRGIVPIAADGSGNYVCLDLRRGAERVAFWDKRRFWGTGEWRESDFHHVANSFKEFLASLRPSPY